MKTKNQLFDGKQKVFREIPAEKNEEEMKFHDAVRLLEHRDHDERIFAAREVFEKRRAEANDPEERGVCDYYLLRLALGEHLLFENQRVKKLYVRMRNNFLEAEEEYFNRRKENLSGAEQKILLAQTKAFYEIIDSYFSAIEKIYREKGFTDAIQRTHENKMDFRKKYAKATGKHAIHLGHAFFQLTCRYGHSFPRWGVTVAVFISIYAGLYALADFFSKTSMFEGYEYSSGFWDYFYYSTVTMTTLGYGDISPVTGIEKGLAMTEAIIGYIMLSIFITLIQKRFNQ